MNATTNRPTQIETLTAPVDGVVIPRAANVPFDMAALNVVAVLGFCPVAGAEKRARIVHIRSLIATALAA